MNQPFVSILIPTRNRAAMLGNAITCALSQTYQNIEIIVSNNASTDQTSEVLAGFDDPRLKTISTNQVLKMHDHWRFLLEHATGDWVLFLCDDDALISSAVSIGVAAMASTNLDLVCWRWAFFDIDKKQMRFAIGNDQASKVNAKEVAQKLLNGDLSPTKPQLNNCLIPRANLVKMIKEFPYAFSTFGGDFATAIYLLSTRIEYAAIDQPMSIFTEWPGSISYAVEALDHAAVDRYVAAGGGYPELAYEMPLHRLPLIANRIFSTSLAARRAANQEQQLDWNPEIYFLICWQEILRAFDTMENRKYFADALAEFPDSTRERVKTQLGKEAGFQKKTVKSSWRMRPFVQRLEWALRPSVRPARNILCNKIENAGSAARSLETNYEHCNRARLPQNMGF